jgi:hypothetical protein
LGDPENGFREVSQVNSRGVQVGGEVRRWQDPTGAFSYVLLRLTPHLEQLPGRGVLILTNPTHTDSSALIVRDLRREYQSLLLSAPDGAVGYWANAKDDSSAHEIFAGLTERPKFADRF